MGNLGHNRSSVAAFRKAMFETILRDPAFRHSVSVTRFDDIQFSLQDHSSKFPVVNLMCIVLVSHLSEGCTFLLSFCVFFQRLPFVTTRCVLGSTGARGLASSS